MTSSSVNAFDRPTACMLPSRFCASNSPSNKTMSSSNCTGIDPNPDISGSGVRTAIYAQAVLTLIQPLLASLDGRITEDELDGLHQLYLGILLPGCALLFSAIIQAKTFGLSVYHGIIVLNLSWINNTSALIFFEFALIAQLKLDKERDFRRRAGDMLVSLYKMLDSLVDKGPNGRECYKSAMNVVRRTRVALESGVENREGSREILGNVARGLRLLEAYGNSFNGELNAPIAERLDEAKEALKELMESDKIRLPKSLGVPFPKKKYRLMAIGKMKEAVVKKCAPVTRRIPPVPGWDKVTSLLRRDWTMATLASAHLTLFAGFGLWLWFEIHSFGINRDCTPFTSLSVIVDTIPVTSPALRGASIAIYLICLLPYINIVVFGGMELATIWGFRRLAMKLFRNPENSRSLIHSPHVLYMFIFLTLVVQVYFITATELSIHNNGHLLEQNQDEEEWTFGQTLAVALTVIPLIQVVKEIKTNLDRWLAKK